MRQQVVKFPTDLSEMQKAAASVDFHCSLEVLSIDGIKSGLPSWGVVPAFLVVHTHRGSVLILRDRDLDL